LETFASPDELYLARGAEVAALRPPFTGDVVADVAIPCVQDEGMAIVVAHPCSMRGREARLYPRVLMAAVRPSEKMGPAVWAKGHFAFMPLPDLHEPGGLYVAHLDEIGRSLTDDVLAAERIACLSNFGVSLLQQRLIFWLTRHEVPTFQLQQVSAHVFEEADLLEEWNETVCAAGLSREDASARFEVFLRACGGAGGGSRQDDLRDPQRRSAVRIACRNEARRIVDEVEG